MIWAGHLADDYLDKLLRLQWSRFQPTQNSFLNVCLCPWNYDILYASNTLVFIVQTLRLFIACTTIKGWCRFLIKWKCNISVRKFDLISFKIFIAMLRNLNLSFILFWWHVWMPTNNRLRQCSNDFVHFYSLIMTPYSYLFARINKNV